MEKLATAHDLQARIRIILNTVDREFRPLTDAQLRHKPAPDRWSILECLQHLNLAERFYVRNIQHKVDRLGLVQTNPTDQPLESDWIGKLMLWAIDPKMNVKLPAPGMVRPRRPADLDPTNVMDQFIELQTLLRDLLNKAVYLNWNDEKVMTMYGNWLKIRLGDALRMLVAHSERHLAQAMRVKGKWLLLSKKPEDGLSDVSDAVRGFKNVPDQQLNRDKRFIFGVVSTGDIWQIAQLESSVFTEYTDLFTLRKLDELFSALTYVLEECKRVYNL